MANVRFLICVVFIAQDSGSVSGFWCLFSVAGFDSYCPSNHNMYIKDDSSLPFEGVWCLDEELDYISNDFQKIYIYVCVGLRSNGISIIPHQCPWMQQEALLTVLGIISLPRLLKQREWASLPGLGWEDRKCPSFCWGKSASWIPAVMTGLCMIFPRFSKIFCDLWAKPHGYFFPYCE